MAKNERKHGHSARNGNRASPYNKYNKKPYLYNMAEIDRNRAKAAALGIHYVDYMNGRREDKKTDRFKEAA